MEYIVNLNLSEYLLLFQILGVYLGVEFQTHPIMNIKRNIIFALESRKKNGVPIVENVPIRMRVIYASQRIEFTTGYRIDVAKWDSDKQRVKNGCTNKLKQSASEINADLLKYYTEIQNVFKEFEVQETMPTTQQLKDAFNLRMKDTSEDQEDVKISFWEVFDEFVKECGNQNNWTESTYEKFAAVKNHLKEFKEDLTFEYFNEFGLNEYVNFLRDKKDMRNSTIGKQMGFLKWFLRWSFKKDAGADPLLSGVVQVGFLGALALIASFLFETPHLPGSGTEWLVVLALALVCSGFGFTLQPVAQSGTTADHAALFCALNPFVAAALGAVCFHEHFGIAGVLGGVLILAGILVSCWPQKTGG